MIKDIKVKTIIVKKHNPPSDPTGEWWDTNPTASFDTYPELRDKEAKCERIQK